MSIDSALLFSTDSTLYYYFYEETLLLVGSYLVRLDRILTSTCSHQVPPTNYLKYRLPLRYAARTDEVRWEWKDSRTGRLIHRELIGGGRNSDLDKWE